MELLISISREGKQYTPEQIEALPEFSIGHAESKFKVRGKQGWVAFDNVNGFGNTPNGQNVLYKGCVAIMDMEKLLSAFPDIDKREQASYEMLDLIKQGHSIASPFLDLDIDPFVEKEEGLPVFKGHEGRARMWALHKLGVKELPVQIIFLGYRARHVENQEEFKHWMNKGVKLEKSDKVASNLFKDILFG